MKYTDSDSNDFLDTIEYDYDGDREIDLKVSLLDYKTPANPHPDVVPLIDTRTEGWQGLNETFTKIANQSFQEALVVYRAAWRKGLTMPEIDKLASAASIVERYDHGYWLKEKVFREIRGRIRELKQTQPNQGATLDKLEKDIIKLYYLGEFEEYAKRILEIPGR